MRLRVDRVRLTGFSAAILMQAAFLALLIQSLHLGVARKAPPREWTILLPKLSEPPAPARTAPAIRMPVLRAPPQDKPLVTAPPTGKDLQGIGRALFGCAPQDLATLPDEQRSACLSARSGSAINPPNWNPLKAPSHARDEKRWATALARKNTPVLAPGASTDRVHVKLWSSDPDADTLVKAVTNGTVANPESHPGYDTGR
jgi:hypothetical protein